MVRRSDEECRPMQTLDFLRSRQIFDPSIFRRDEDEIAMLLLKDLPGIAASRSAGLKKIRS
jgi:hypothetical protein